MYCVPQECLLRPDMEGVVAKLAGLRPATDGVVAAAMAPYLLSRYDRNYDHVLQATEVSVHAVFASHGWTLS